MKTNNDATTEAAELAVERHLDAEREQALTLLLAAIYACAGRLDKDEVADDAGEPLRTIGNKLEEIFDLDIQLDKGFLLAHGQEYAESAELGLAYAVDHHIMPSRVVHDLLDDDTIARVLADHDDLIGSQEDGWMVCSGHMHGCDYRVSADEATVTHVRKHQAAMIRAEYHRD